MVPLGLSVFCISQPNIGSRARYREHMTVEKFCPILGISFERGQIPLLPPPDRCRLYRDRYSPLPAPPVRPYLLCSKWPLLSEETLKWNPTSADGPAERKQTMCSSKNSPPKSLIVSLGSGGRPHEKCLSMGWNLPGNGAARRGARETEGRRSPQGKILTFELPTSAKRRASRVRQPQYTRVVPVADPSLKMLDRKHLLLSPNVVNIFSRVSARSSVKLSALCLTPLSSARTQE